MSLPTSPDRPSAPLRVGDAEREQVARQLGDHHVAGRLDAAELDDRLTAVYAARTRSDLAATLSDLPPLPAPVSTTRPPRRPDPAEVGFRLHLVAYLATIAALWLVWAVTGGGHPWPVWPMLGWGLGLLGHRSGPGACRLTAPLPTELAPPGSVRHPVA